MGHSPSLMCTALYSLQNIFSTILPQSVHIAGLMGAYSVEAEQAQRGGEAPKAAPWLLVKNVHFAARILDSTLLLSCFVTLSYILHPKLVSLSNMGIIIRLISGA